jgi:hypothetical protein
MFVVNKAIMAGIMDVIFIECHILRDKCHDDYARTESAFANFERLALDLGLPKEKILLVYATKHWDGIKAYVNGTDSKREDVTGRIKDLIVYLCLLYGMHIEKLEREKPEKPEKPEICSTRLGGF